MKVFHCDHCDHLVFFESVQCLKCGATLGFAFDQNRIVSLEPKRSDNAGSAVPTHQCPPYRLCRNYSQEHVCNWLVGEAEQGDYCISCQLTKIIPDASIAEHRAAWGRLESAKRRLIYQLQQLHLPIASQVESPKNGLAFEFLADPPNGPRVMTGHANGTITISLAEADDAEREVRRINLHEPYRTLLGHFRHEVGHYYWDRLIRDSAHLEEFRSLFGNEQEDYSTAMERYYQIGAPGDWQQRFVSAYASSHAWEDWAETWAHYLHITDTLETARDCGLTLRPRRSHEPTLQPTPIVQPFASPFEQVIDDWFALTYILNNLNRGMGLPDGYPFVLSTPAVDKLRFIHDLIPYFTVNMRTKRHSSLVPA